MNLIACVDNNWAIGKDDELLFHIKEDLHHFKLLTENNIVIYGRKTLETFPNKEPLRNRINIILTTDTEFTIQDAYIVHSIEELIILVVKLEKEYPCKEQFVIGGESIYNQLLKFCNEAYITKVYSEIEGSNKFFPNLDNDDNWNWNLSKLNNYDEKTGLKYDFYRYKNFNRPI